MNFRLPYQNYFLYLIFCFIAITLLLGSLLIFSSTTSITNEKISWSPILVKQLSFLFIGLCIFIIISQINYKIWFSYAWVFYTLGIIFLILVFVPGIGLKAGGASRWIKLGFLSFQSSDFMKIGIILTISRFFSIRYNNSNQKFSHLDVFIIMAIVFIPAFFIIIEPDFSTGILLLASFFIFLVLTKFPTILIIGITAVILPLVTIIAIRGPYRLERLLAFLDPYANRYTSGYQLIVSYKSFISGGLFGQGLGNGIQNKTLKASYTDFMFSVISEELGFISIFLFIIILAVLIIFLIIFAKNLEEPFGRHVILFIAILLGCQSIISIGVSIGILPTTGIGLPLISYGGSSVIVYLFLMGIATNIIQQNNQKRLKNNPSIRGTKYVS